MLRDKASQVCAAVGVLLLVAASILHGETYAVFVFLAGLALIAVAHVLAPCRDQITRWWRERVLKQ